MQYSSADEGRLYLRRLLRHNQDSLFAQMVGDRFAVQREYGRVFHPDNLQRLTATTFKEFLLYEHNRHWWGIHRHQAKLVADMDLLHRVLRVLVDESTPIGERVDWIDPPTGQKPLPGMGKAVYTPIIHVVYPNTYGVWNSVAESAMQRLRLWPSIPRGSTQGDRYTAINSALHMTAQWLEIDLWTLDSLWWLTEKEHEPTRHQFSGGEGSGSNTPKGQRSSRASARNTFQCARCFLTKSTSLRSSDPDVCLDCNPDY